MDLFEFYSSYEIFLRSMRLHRGVDHRARRFTIFNQVSGNACTSGTNTTDFSGSGPWQVSCVWISHHSDGYYLSVLWHSLRSATERELMHILVISGSLRAGSTTGALVRALAALAPANAEIAIYDGLAGLPHFSRSWTTISPRNAASRRSPSATCGRGFRPPTGL